MSPEIKATVALPFAISTIAFLFYLIAIHPAIVIYPLFFMSFAAIIGSVWYALYRSFGGEI